MVMTLENTEIDRLSLMYALARGIETTFQLEPRELDLELIGNESAPRLLFTEASEGGAGVLSRLAQEPQAMADVARAALSICHFTNEGDDTAGSDGHDPCVKACYDCLLSYYNQRYHQDINRHAVMEPLSTLAAATVEPHVAGVEPAEHRDRLLAACHSDLERKLVNHLFERGYRLPDEGQYPMPNFGAQADFAYPDLYTVIFVDGPPHDPADIQAADAALDKKLCDNGITPIRFNYKASWAEIIARYPSVFGKGSDS
jgi:hypothetical protein